MHVDQEKRLLLSCNSRRKFLMGIAILPKEEETRGTLLKQFAILDTPREEKFDRIVRLACRLTGAPIGMVTLADTNRMWFKACMGLTSQEVPRELAFCPYALSMSETLVIENASVDPRFASNPLVTGPDHIRFYAGAQLRTTEGIVLGTLCVLDRKPKHLDATDVAALEDLAHGVIAELELRRVSARLERQLDEQTRLADELTQTRARLEDFLGATSDLLWETDRDLAVTYGGGGEIKGLNFETFRGLPLEDAVAAFPLGADRQRFAADLAAREPFRLMQFGRRNADGSESWVETSGKPILTSGEFQGYRGVSRDISARKAAEDRIRRMADEDPLTGLANRRTFQKRLNDILDRRTRNSDGNAILLLDIDHFKDVNDRYGHDIGDRMIRAVGQRVASVIREGDTLARLGGDEFAVILNCVDKAMAEDIAQRIVAAMREPIATPNGEVTPSVSVGAALVQDKTMDADTAFKRADIALYQAKNAGRGRYALLEGRH